MRGGALEHLGGHLVLGSMGQLHCLHGDVCLT
jgi:hypothetical protein